MKGGMASARCRPCDGRTGPEGPARTRASAPRTRSSCAGRFDAELHGCTDGQCGEQLVARELTWKECSPRTAFRSSSITCAINSRTRLSGGFAGVRRFRRAVETNRHQVPAEPGFVREFSLLVTATCLTINLNHEILYQLSIHDAGGWDRQNGSIWLSRSVVPAE